MCPRKDVFEAKSVRELPATEEAIDALMALGRDEPDKTLVIRYIGGLVAGGFGNWELLETGEIKLSIASGEVFMLSKSSVLRIS